MERVYNNLGKKNISNFKMENSKKEYIIPSGVYEIISTEDFDIRIGQEKLTIVDFFATWCGPCNNIAPKFIELSHENPEIQFIKVDVDKYSDITERYGINSMPTFMFFYNGKIIEGCKVEGANLPVIKQKIAMFKDSIN